MSANRDLRILAITPKYGASRAVATARSIRRSCWELWIILIITIFIRIGKAPASGIRRKTAAAPGMSYHRAVASRSSANSKYALIHRHRLAVHRLQVQVHHHPLAHHRHRHPVLVVHHPQVQVHHQAHPAAVLPVVVHHRRPVQPRPARAVMDGKERAIIHS